MLHALFQEILQSISDHEPDYVSLKRNAHTICEGPSDGKGLLANMSQMCESSAGFVAEAQLQMLGRPGQAVMQSILSNYDRRLEELKKKLKVCLSERESLLERTRECDSLLSEMMSWMKGADLEGLRVRDPSSAVIQNQKHKCQVLTLPTTTCTYICTYCMCITRLYWRKWIFKRKRRPSCNHLFSS